MLGTSTEEIIQQGDLHEFIKSIVNDKRYLALKDAFVAHVTKGEASEHSTSLSHGKYLGTVYVFNAMESEAKSLSKKETDQANKAKAARPQSIDPDLEE